MCRHAKQVAPLIAAAGSAKLENGGAVRVTGRVPPGSQVSIEVWSERRVRASFFDSKKDEATGAIPCRLYLSREIPAYYRIYVPGMHPHPAFPDAGRCTRPLTRLSQTPPGGSGFN